MRLLRHGTLHDADAVVRSGIINVQAAEVACSGCQPASMRVLLAGAVLQQRWQGPLPQSRRLLLLLLLLTLLLLQRRRQLWRRCCRCLRAELVLGVLRHIHSLRHGSRGDALLRRAAVQAPHMQHAMRPSFVSKATTNEYERMSQICLLLPISLCPHCAGRPRSDNAMRGAGIKAAPRAVMMA